MSLVKQAQTPFSGRATFALRRWRFYSTKYSTCLVCGDTGTLGLSEGLGCWGLQSAAHRLKTLDYRFPRCKKDAIIILCNDNRLLTGDATEMPTRCGSDLEILE